MLEGENGETGVIHGEDDKYTQNFSREPQTEATISEILA